MGTSLQYIRNYGCVSFNEKPFCDADSIALCEIFYMPLEKAGPESFEEEITFQELCQNMYKINGSRHVAPGLVLQKKISKKMMEMSEFKRFAEMRVTGFMSAFDTSPSVQFCAATFILPDKSVVVVFRGTDDSLNGWVEDIDILTKSGIPSHQLSVDYLERAAAHFSGDIYVCGHSKGGNVALYSALNCSDETRKRIKVLYNHEGPGFHNYDYLSSPSYSELLPKYKHYVPHSSFVGTMLAHDDDYTVVKTNIPFIGPMQHDLSTWKIENDALQTASQLSAIGKLNDLFFLNMLLGIDSSKYAIVDAIADSLLTNSGMFGLLDLSHQPKEFIKGVKKAWDAVAPETRQQAAEVFSGTVKLIALCAKAVKEDAFPAVAKRASDISAVLLA